MHEFLIGREKHAIPTPALLIDLDKMEYNIAKMANFCREQKINLRPHIKTHKTPLIAHKQIAAGAIGITCQKLAEAEVMVESGIQDILISNEIVELQKIERLVNLAKHTKIKVCVDNNKNIKDISKAAQQKGVHVGILVEVDIGMQRCGVPPDEPAFKLASEVVAQANLEFLGIMGYEGHTVLIKSYKERKYKAEQAMKLLTDTANLLEKRNLKCSIVSAGGTGTYNITGCYPGVTEIQAGSYVTMDSTYKSVEGAGDDFGQALSLLTTVISRPNRARAVLDAGMKAITTDMGVPQVMQNTNIQVERINEEHTILTLERMLEKDLGIGEKIELIPTHGCTTINLHECFYGIRENRVESIWRIQARGKYE